MSGTPAAKPAATNAEVGHDGGHATGVFPPFDPAHFPSQIFWFAITFAALYIVVSRSLAPKLGAIVEGRKARIASDFANAEAMKKQAEAAALSYESGLAEARKRAGALAGDARAKLNTEMDARRASAEQGLSAKLAEAENRISGIKDKAMAEVDAIAAETADALISTLAGHSVARDKITGAVAAAKS